LLIHYEFTLYHEEIAGMPDIICILTIEIGFAECQVIYGIEKVGLPDSIIANETIKLWREFNIKLMVSFKIEQI